MGQLSTDLKDMGYDPTEQESPFDDNGMLWTKGYELVCDETGMVIDDTKVRSRTSFKKDKNEEKTYRYRNSGNVKLIGGYLGSYEWGETDDGFTY